MSSDVVITTRLLEYCFELGLDLAGVTDALPPETYNRFVEWLNHDMHAGMTYLEKHRNARQTPDFLLQGVKSLIVVGLFWEKTQIDDLAPIVSGCQIARYAWGADYHLVLWEKLRKLAAFHHRLLPNEKTRCVIDTAPILEREYAFRAGLGWFGKNTMLINEKLGHEFFIGLLLSTAKFEIPEKNQRFQRDFSLCGSCQQCLEQCPTGALTAPYVLDARKCLNYWTIEHQGKIPQEIARKMGNRLFGCDVCQAVCPFQPKQGKCACKTCQPYELFRPETEQQESVQHKGKIFSREELENMDETDFEHFFGKTALFRTGLDGMKRNLVIVRENEERRNANK